VPPSEIFSKKIQITLMGESFAYKSDAESHGTLMECVARERNIDDGSDSSEASELEKGLASNVALLSDPDTNIVFDGLDWLEDRLLKINFVLPDDCMQRLMDLIMSEESSLARQAVHVISLSTSFHGGCGEAFIRLGILGFIRDNFPNLGTANLSYNLAVNSAKARDALIEMGYCDLIRLLFDADHQDILTIVQLCKSLVNWPLEFGPHTNMIFDLFSRLPGYLDEMDIDICIEIAKTFRCFIRASPHFLCGIVDEEFLAKFIDLRIDEPDFKLNVLGILSWVCNFGPEFIPLVIGEKPLGFACDTLVKEDEEDVVTASIDFISDVCLLCPESIRFFSGRNVPRVIVDKFFSDAIGDIKIAAVHFCIVSMALSSEMFFDKLYLVGCVSVVLEGIGMADSDEMNWILRILVRCIRNENKEHTDEYREMLKGYPDVIRKLEELRGCESVKESMMAGTILDMVYPEFKN
jgi:hypothetical protein